MSACSTICTSLCHSLAPAAHATREGAIWLGRQIQVQILEPIDDLCRLLFIRMILDGYQAGVYIKAGALYLGRQIAAASMWAGRAIRDYTFHPLCQLARLFYHHIIQPSYQYVINNKRDVAANLLSWGLILVFCGAIHGFNAVSLPMLYGMLPGFCLGGLVGIIIGKLSKNEEDNNPGFFHSLSQQYNELPTWATTLILALGASIFMAACTVTPHGAGAILGAFAAMDFMMRLVRYDPAQQEHQQQLRVDEMTQLRLEITALRRELDQRLPPPPNES